MQYILVENQTTILLGPFFWNRYRTFQSELTDLEVDFVIPPVEQGYIKINDNLEIFPVVDSSKPQSDPIYEQYVGPTYTYNNNEATETWTKQYQDINFIKQNIKGVIAATRYNKEIAGTTITISGESYTLPTDRTTKQQFSYLLTSNVAPVSYKFPEGFCNLDQNTLQSCVDTINNYVQAQFNWENTLHATIDNANTIEDLKNINVQ